MLVKVWQWTYDEDKPVFGFGIDAEQAAKILAKKHPNLRYVAVANVDAGTRSGVEALDYAFERTNTIDQGWWLNNDVTLCASAPRRSTSTGDAIELNGEFWVVAPVGFEQVKKELT